MAHPELGTKILDQVLDVVGSYVKVETQARLEGRNMSMVLSPDKKALDAAEPPTDDDARPSDAVDDASTRPNRPAAAAEPCRPAPAAEQTTP